MKKRRCKKCGKSRMRVRFKKQRSMDVLWCEHERANYPNGECLIYHCEECGYEEWGPCADQKESDDDARRED